MKKSLFIAFFLIFVVAITVFSQTFEVPEGYSFKNKDDYAQYEKDVVAASKWLFATSLDEQEVKRKLVAKFVAEWLLGCPTVQAEMSQAIMDFEKKNPGMIVLYFAGCTLYVLEHDHSRDTRAKHRFALQAMMDFYKGDKGIRRDKKMKDLIKENENGRLDEWIQKNIPLQD
ncbi:MAG: hypothetical protein IPP72_18150 [Chitinophagaceae bacterium]|nr:hypothetical protein [Chitinophagaceae bacterium]